MVESPIKSLYVAAGFICLVLGVIGIFLPIMPTAPFVILAAFCFSKGSERWHRWLLNIPYFGKTVEEWEQHHMIRPGAKLWATLCICGLFVSTIVFVKVSVVIKAIVAAIGIAVLGFILTRPSHPKDQNTKNT